MIVCLFLKFLYLFKITFPRPLHVPSDYKIILAFQEKRKVERVKSVVLTKKHVLSEYPKSHKEGAIKANFQWRFSNSNAFYFKSG